MATWAAHNTTAPRGSLLVRHEAQGGELRVPARRRAAVSTAPVRKPATASRRLVDQAPSGSSLFSRAAAAASATSPGPTVSGATARASAGRPARARSP